MRGGGSANVAGAPHGDYLAGYGRITPAIEAMSGTRTKVQEAFYGELADYRLGSPHLARWDLYTAGWTAPPATTALRRARGNQLG